MAMERRGNGFYFYTSKRVGSRVVKQYFGCRSTAKLIAKIKRLERKKRELAHALRKAKAKQQSRRLDTVRQWWATINECISTALLATGWHQHKREWRRKRGHTMDHLQTTVDHTTWVPSELSVKAGDLCEMIREKAFNGDQSAISDVDNFLQNPSAIALWGDFGRFVLAKWIQKMAGQDLLSRRAAFRFASDLRDRLAGPSASALERLLAERVVIAWVFANWSDLQYATNESTSIPVHEFHCKRTDLANRQLLSACKTLAKVKRVRLPDVMAMVKIGAL